MLGVDLNALAGEGSTNNEEAMGKLGLGVGRVWQKVVD